ncbi:MAG TPA: aminotransferase class I/II-fold pyridoxal phosphate-dependent enzyme [Egibacteraceae bacterium]|jgi:aspartate/methionine/tyrosine aminotransferase|nr:aminotransferase class I/II-fold pyridoxal phosphate-dependent enzyme [Egibacteraceae bacterium]
MRLPPFALERYFAQHEFTAPMLLCASDVEPMTLPELLALADDGLRAHWESLSLGYTESGGHPLLREAIASSSDSLGAEDVLVFAGAEEAIFAFANVTVGPGDHVVVVWPAYQSLHEVARAVGADVTLVRLEHDAGWALDAEAVRQAMRPTTRAIIVNFPHNPTGAHIDRSTFDALIGLAEESGAWLFSDEVYRYLELPRSSRLPGAAELSESAVSLGVMSKSFALPGLRIGWIAARDRRLLDRLAAFKDYTTICNAAPSEVLALIALRNLERVVDRSRQIVDANLSLLDDFFERCAGTFDWVRPRGASIAFPRLLAETPIEQFAEQLITEEGVVLLPGSVYGHPGNHFRLGFGRRNLPEALERLEVFADRHLGAR